MASLLRETVLPLRETVLPLLLLLRAAEPVPAVPVPRVAADPLRAEVEPVVRTAEEEERETPGVAERATLVRPVEERRLTVVPEVPPARVRPLRLAPPRETKLRELREASRPPTSRAWLFRWIQRPLQPPTP